MPLSDSFIIYHLMKRQLTYAAAIAALLLVGAGCAARQQAAEGLNVQPPVGGVRGTAEVKTQAKVEGTVNGTVDAILKDSEDEKTVQQEHEGDASNVNADDAELNAYSDTSYELK